MPPRRPAAIRWLQTALEFAVGGLVALLVVIVLWGVFTRFVLDAPSWWTEEAARLLLIWLTMLGAAAAGARREHLGLDFFANQLAPDAHRALAVFTELVVAGFAGAVLVYGGTVLVVETLRAGQLTAALNLPMGHVYLAVPIGGVCLVAFALERVYALWCGAPVTTEHPTTD